ncbi:glycosyltransferase family 4 protein [Sphingobacterium chuzhouense]|uniref:Glycosyltransferase family 4 protein n=1 Tax=Sphingobacterium chuzhouense TaxID=1742264 RepID=A0ABR7XTJ9_9SPHI|nr:glycosyltransferase family 4 protein [Sphingobacterium chuzhouense]MBD1422495.1 glycosyltransferase family 4 protein [Sphingobacterium chuzhouense]
MKIVYNILGTFNSGGMERVLANKANYFVAQGLEVAIVTTDQQGRSPYFPLNEAIQLHDLDINYTENNQHGLWKKIISYQRKQKQHKQLLTSLLQDLKADIVISMFDNDASFLYRIQDGSKKVLEIHFSRFKRLQYGRKGLWKIIDRLRSWQDVSIAKRYDRFVVLTEEDKQYWGNLPNIVVIPNANSFVPNCQADVKAKRAIAVGRYDYQKGFDELIALWRKIYEQKPDWKLDIFGHGPLKNKLQSQINQLGLADVIRLCSPVWDIEKEYCQSGLLVMTSRYEGLPMTLLEAQTYGLPMVAYACKCGPRDIIRDGENGFLVEEHNQEMMVARLIQLMENENLRWEMGRKAKEMSTDFTEAKVMRKWLDLFNQLTP